MALRQPLANLGAEVFGIDIAQNLVDGRVAHTQRVFVKNHLGISANVQIEPPAGTFVDA